MGCPPSHEEQSRMYRETEARIKRAMETGGIHCDPSAAPTRDERMGRIALNYQKFVSGTLHSRWMDYFEEMLDFAATVFEQRIVPFCDERGWDFSTGPGWWRMDTSREDPLLACDHPEDEAWQAIAAILTTTVKGLDYDFGCLMPSYQPEETDGTERKETGN